MAELKRHGSNVTSVFDLVGHNENDLTAALGYALSQCPPLLTAILQRLQPHVDAALTGDASLALEVRDARGRTDLEITLPDALLICEAKRGWLLPSKSQLSQYVGRVRRQGDGALVTLSQASTALASFHLPAEIKGVPVVHLPWIDIMTDIADVRPSCRGRERLWLEELRTYLRGAIRVRSVADSWTYSVVLNNQRTGGKRNLSFLEWVRDKHIYYHPYGTGGWPTEPPNFMAFRWDGAVQRIHRVEEADVVPTLLDRFPDLPGNEFTLRPHAIYKLSARRLPPLEPIPNGAQYRAGRLWVLLDQLQSSDTLAEALQRTRDLTQAT